MKKLYDQLFADGDFTGTFEDFKKQYGDADKSKVLFDALSEEGDYTQDFESFNSQFGFEPAKTKAVATETALVTAEDQAVDTDLVSENGSSDLQKPKPVTEEQALFNYKQRTGEDAGSVMDLTDEDYEPNAFLKDFEPVDQVEVFDRNRTRIEELKKKRKELEVKATRRSSKIMSGIDSAAYVDEELSNFDREASIEVQRMEANPTFKLYNDAVSELEKDTGNNQATGDALSDIGSEFGIFNLFKGKSYYKNREANEVININQDVEKAVVSKLNERDLQKLSKGFFTLQEKENLINEVKIPIIKQKNKEIQSEVQLNFDKTQQEVNKLNKSKLLLLESINSFDKENLTKQQASDYNKLVEDFNSIDVDIKNTVSGFESYKNKSLLKVESLEGEYGIDLSKGVINNNFKISNDVDKFREKYSGDGFWNGTLDIIGGDLVQGSYQLFKKATVGSGAWLLSNIIGDTFTDQDNYSNFDAFSDVVSSWTNKTLVASSTSEKFSITKQEGGFKDFNIRSYTKLGVSMVPFTGFLINEVRKGNYSGVRSAIGNSYMRLGSRTKILKPASQKLKDNIIMADAAFRATILDNQKQGEKLGLNGFQANTYATALSTTEGLVQTIMPDSQFLKGVKGKAIKDAFLGNLKKVATKEGAKSASKEFITNIGKELLEEEVNAGVGLVLDMSYGLALPKGSEFLNSQIELLAGTLMLSSSTGSIGAVNTYNSQKTLIYNQIHNNISSLDLQLKTMAEKSKNQEVIDQIKATRQFALDVSKAIESSPENVTSDQIELLLEKQKLIKKKKSTDSAFHPAINEEIQNIDSKIESSAVKRTIAKKFDKDVANVGKSLNSIGQKVDETIIFEDGLDGEANFKMKQFLLKNPPSDIKAKGSEAIEKYAEENKNAYGSFTTTADGKEVLIINKQSALKDSFVTTGQHEFLHKVLRASLASNPKIVTEAGALLLQEINSMTEEGSELKARISQYGSSTVKDGKTVYKLAKGVSEQQFYEEILPLFSEALTRKDVKLNKSALQKVGDLLRQVLQNVGLKNVKFKTADDVKNFITDYNKAFSKGKIKGALKEFAKGETKAASKKASTSFSKANKELGDEIKALVPEGTSKSRYDNQVIGNVYEKLVFGKTLDGLINGQLNKYGVVGDNVYGKPKDIFLEDVKAQLYEKSLMRFNPETNDDLGGFVVNELIKYRIGDVVNRYKKEAGVEGKSLDVAAGEVGSVQEVADESMSIEDKIDLDATRARSETRLTKATKIMSKEQYDKAAKMVEEKLKDIDPKKLSYKKIGGLATDILSEITDVPAGKILDATKNLSKEETSRGAMFIEKNIDYIRKTLPKGAVQEAATEKLMGTATGVANSILKRLYDKNPRIKKGAGLSPWSIKPGITNQDVLDAIGRPKREDDRKIQINPRSPEGQVIKGILNLVDRNIANELARTVESDLTLEQKQDVAAGKSSTMFSKSFSLGLEAGSNTDNINSVLFSKSARNKYEQVLRAKRPELKDITEQVDNLISWADSLDVKENKKAKYKKLGLFYMANGYVIFPEDGYKVAEAIRLSTINKVDPYAFNNPNELIEKYEKVTKIAKVNPDTVSEFSNKEEISGYTIYDVQDSKKGQEAVRRIVDSNWGEKSNPWCLVARTNDTYLGHEEAYSEKEVEDIIATNEALGNTVEREGHYMSNGRKVYELVVYAPKNGGELARSFGLWKGYNESGNGFKIAFKNGKLNSFRDGNDMLWWDRMDKPKKGPDMKAKPDANGLIADGYFDLESGNNVVEGYGKDYKKGNLTIEEEYNKDKELTNRNTFEATENSNKSLIESYSMDKLERGDYIETESKYKNATDRTIKTTRKLGDVFEKETRILYFDKNDNFIEDRKYKNIKNGVVTEEINITDNVTADTLTIYKAETIDGKKNVLIDERKNFIGGNVLFSKPLAIEKLLIQEFINEKHKDGVSSRRKNTYARKIKELLEYGGLNGVENFEKAVEAGNYTENELELINFVFEGRDWLFGLFQNEKEQNQGIKLEKLVKVAIKKIGLKDVDLNLSEGGFSSGVDIVLSTKQGKLNIELKLNEKARVGSFSIKRAGDTFSYTKGAEGLETKIPELHEAMQEALKGDKYQKAWRKYTEEGIKIGKKLLDSGKVDIETYVDEDTGQLVGPREVFELLKKNKYQKALTISINEVKIKNKNGKEVDVPLDQKVIELLYNNKDVHDINFGGTGMYALGESISGMPKLEADVVVNIVTSRSGSSSGVYRSIQRATPFIKIIRSTTDIDLADLSQVGPNIESLVKSIESTNFSKSINLDKEFNDIIENKTGIESYKNYKRVKAQVTGASKGKFNFFIAPSAEDFVGLLYKTLGKGKVGDAQMAWYKENLLDPYARAMQKVSRDRNFMARNFLAIKKELKIVPKNLKKKIPGEPFTQEQAIRVYIWNKKGSTIPEISENDSIYLTNFVENNEKLKTFADQVIALSGLEDYAKPGDSWVTGTITTDMLEALNTTKRAKYLELWQQNADEIFSEKNLNKLEAAYGADYRNAMENILKRMKTGRNRAFGGDSLTGRFVDWMTGATGAIMFFNTRSAVLQTLSAVNFINFGDNNIFAASKAFANQKQYWSDFKKLFNSDFLVERRDGLKINVNEADIADIAKEKGVRGLINKLLKLGFTPTQLADSFAIATGGATFYRNRLKSLIKDGMDPVAAEKQAMTDFRETAEESQQSSRPDKISAQQAGPLGRTILAFANTPAQYARIIKKAASDIKNGRGDLKTNISKIMYYGVAQNLIFNALQQALFAAVFDEDEEEIDDKTISIANGMADSILRGIGISGAIISVVKNAALRWVKEEEKANPKYENAILELTKISPPVSSKINKLRAASRSYSWDKKEMKEGGLSIDNPANLAIGNVVSAVTNIPLDRVVKKVQHIKTASDSEIDTYKRIFLLAGWSKWELGIKEASKKKKKKKKSKKIFY